MASSRPARFAIDTDYRTLKRNVGFSRSKLVPGGQVIAPGATYEWSAEATSGELGSLSLTLISSSGNGRGYSYLPGVAFTQTGSVLGSPATYSMVCIVTRSSATTFKCIIQITNPYSDPLTTQAANDAVNFIVFPIVPPYE